MFQQVFHSTGQSALCPDISGGNHGSARWLLYTALNEQQRSAVGGTTQDSARGKNINLNLCLILAALESNLSDYKLKNNHLHDPTPACTVSSNMISLITQLFLFPGELFPRENATHCTHSACFSSHFPQLSASVSNRAGLKVTKLPRVPQRLRGQTQAPACGKRTRSVVVAPSPWQQSGSSRSWQSTAQPRAAGQGHGCGYCGRRGDCLGDPATCGASAFTRAAARTARLPTAAPPGPGARRLHQFLRQDLWTPRASRCEAGARYGLSLSAASCVIWLSQREGTGKCHELVFSSQHERWHRKP